MKEQERLISLFRKLYDGDPWIDINLVSTLRAISANQANQRPLPNSNTIWEITNHLIAWRMNVLKRIHGEVIKTPSNNYITSVKDPSEDAWKDTLHQLEQTQDHWIQFLKQIKDSDFELVYPNNHMTYYEHIQGILQHDAYHLGQIVLLAKQF